MNHVALLDVLKLRLSQNYIHITYIHNAIVELV